MNKQNYIIGIALIVLGLIGFVDRLLGINLFSMSNFWPVFVLIPGLCFEFGYFSTKKAPGVLVPGGILTTIGCLFFFETFTNWRFSEFTWPVYILAVAIGLFQLYLFGGKQSGLLIPVTILTLVAGTAFTSILFGNIFHIVRGSVFVPLALIVIGICLLFGRNKKS